MWAPAICCDTIHDEMAAALVAPLLRLDFMKSAGRMLSGRGLANVLEIAPRVAVATAALAAAFVLRLRTRRLAIADAPPQPLPPTPPRPQPQARCEKDVKTIHLRDLKADSFSDQATLATVSQSTSPSQILPYRGSHRHRWRR